MASIAAVTVTPARRVRGRLRVPGDKSISHRYAILAALADGSSTIAGFAPGADCASTLSCLRALGVPIDLHWATGASASVTIGGVGLGGFRQAARTLDAANSGTTIRLLTGALSAHRFSTIISGDRSLNRRPMRRVIAPLALMGACIESVDDHPPLTIAGRPLHSIDHTLEIPSAQVKSALLVAGLHADGRTRLIETAPTRNHTELALRAFGADVSFTPDSGIMVRGGRHLQGLPLDVPGDVSSAAFWAAAAAGLDGSAVELRAVGLNRSRVAFLQVLARMGATIDTVLEHDRAGEPSGRIRVRHGGLGSVTIGPSEVPGLIDELPVLAAVATHGGEIRVTGAGELRVKESDRIAALVSGLRALGGDADELPDGFHVSGRHRLAGGEANAAGDHRLAMAFAVAAIGAAGPTTIVGAEAVDVSYPGFFQVLESICR